MVGVELERTVPGDTAAQHLGAASWIGHEGSPKYMWPQGSPTWPTSTTAATASTTQHLHAFAELAIRNAKDNPNAQTRGWQFGDASFSDDDDVNPVVAGRIRRTDCSQVTDGGAGVVLATDAWVARPPRSAGRRAGRPHHRLGPPHRRPAARPQARSAAPTTPT